MFDDTITDDVTFSRALLKEESVFVLPGQCFGAKNFVRIVFCPPIEQLREALNRLAQFCARHTRKDQSEKDEGKTGEEVKKE